jgi:hypothetical protein
MKTNILVLAIRSAGEDPNPFVGLTFRNQLNKAECESIITGELILTSLRYGFVVGSNIEARPLALLRELNNT